MRAAWVNRCGVICADEQRLQHRRGGLARPHRRGRRLGALGARRRIWRVWRFGRLRRRSHLLSGLQRRTLPSSGRKRFLRQEDPEHRHSEEAQAPNRPCGQCLHFILSVVCDELLRLHTAQHVLCRMRTIY